MSLDPATVDQLSEEKLKEELGARGLTTTGSHAELVDVLRGVLEAEKPPAHTSDEPAQAAITKKMERAARFGVPVRADAGEQKAQRQERKERFGTVDTDEKKKARQERFGIVDPVEQRAARKERFGVVDPEEKKEARAERFSARGGRGRGRGEKRDRPVGLEGSSSEAKRARAERFKV